MTAAYILDWLNLIARWAHVIAGISWIGASFYFVWLDDSLVPAERADEVRRGMSGDLWAVHGGGFYHNQKYLTGPRGEPLTHDLHWFKWEAYSTWITGMAMLAIVYWASASTMMIDPSVLAITPAAAIVISIASLAIGWLVYDGLCRAFERHPLPLWITVTAFLLFADWALFHVFGGRAAYLHVGAIVGTIMVANVFFVVIPGQKRMLSQIRAGQEPDPRPGRLGKMRSVHNTYFTLPVLFIMISNHYPMTYGSRNGWIVLAILCAAGVLVRRFFVLTHKHRYAISLTVAAAVLCAAAAVVAGMHAGSTRQLASAPRVRLDRADRREALRRVPRGEADRTGLRGRTARRAARLAAGDRGERAADRRRRGEDARHAAGKRDAHDRCGTRRPRRVDRRRREALMGVTISTHVLDTARGTPAEGVLVGLFAIDDGQRRHVATATTNLDGRTDAPLDDGRRARHVRAAVLGARVLRVRRHRGVLRRDPDPLPHRRGRRALSRAAAARAVGLQHVSRQLTRRYGFVEALYALQPPNVEMSGYPRDSISSRG